MGAGRHASLAAALLVALLARPAAACLGDCSGDGVVSVAELTTGVRAGLGGAGSSECAAWDPDGDGAVHVADLVRGVAAALHGCPPDPTPTASATPTATPTPTATRSDLFAAVAAPFEASCSPFGIIGYEAVDETADGFSLFCRPTAGHEHRTTLRRYATTEAATAAFEAARGGLAPLSLDAVRAAYGERPFHVGGRMCGGLDCGLVREMVWQLDCWVAEMRSADDTHFILTTDPVFLTGELLTSAAAHLRAACGSGGQ